MFQALRARCFPHNLLFEILLYLSCGWGESLRVKGDQVAEWSALPSYTACNLWLFLLCGESFTDNTTPDPISASLAPPRGEEWFNLVVTLEGEWGLCSPGSGREASCREHEFGLYLFLYISQGQVCPWAAQDRWASLSNLGVQSRKAHLPICINHNRCSQLCQ